MTSAEESALFGLARVAPDETMAYGAHPSQVVDFYAALGEPSGLGVTLLHGGFWREAYDRHHLSPLARALAEQGHEVALAEYRRVGGGGGWPMTFHDVRRAAAVARRGAHRQVLVGHSAGGHLALLAAAAEVPGVDAVVAVAPVADLEWAAELGLGGGAVRELLGGENGRAADPMWMLSLGMPVVLLHGAVDPEVPAELSRRYAAFAGVPLRVLDGVGHYAAVTPGTAAFAALRSAISSVGAEIGGA